MLNRIKVLGDGKDNLLVRVSRIVGYLMDALNNSRGVIDKVRAYLRKNLLCDIILYGAKCQNSEGIDAFFDLNQRISIGIHNGWWNQIERLSQAL
jgi:hypothetical protein